MFGQIHGKFINFYDDFLFYFKSHGYCTIVTTVALVIDLRNGKYLCVILAQHPQAKLALLS